MRTYESDYSELVSTVALRGAMRKSRAGNTRAIFGTMLQITCLEQGRFPLLTARKMFYKPVLGELAAFLKGATELKTFKDFGCNYWDANAGAWEENVDRPKDTWVVGQIYGAQWRNWLGCNNDDQLKTLVENLKANPHSRRHVLTTYDPGETYACLPPCHLLAQFNVTNDGNLDCIVYMRSVDLCLGLPSDVVLYATLILVISNQVGLKPGKLVFMMGDTHIYENHVTIWHTQAVLKHYELPKYKLDSTATIDNFRPDHLDLLNYEHGDKLDYTFNV